MPYSCQLQFGTSGSWVIPVGGASTWRAIGLPMSQTSRLTMVQNTMRAPPGSFSGGRSTIAEKSVLSRGSIGFVFFLRRFVIPGHSSLFPRHRFAALARSLQDDVKCHSRKRRQTICRPTDLGQLCSDVAWFRLRDHNRVRTRELALQSAADRSSMEPTRRGLIIFPAFEFPS